MHFEHHPSVEVVVLPFDYYDQEVACLEGHNNRFSVYSSQPIMIKVHLSANNTLESPQNL